jgi:hypothetical protein
VNKQQATAHRAQSAMKVTSCHFSLRMIRRAKKEVVSLNTQVDYTIAPCLYSPEHFQLGQYLSLIIIIKARSSIKYKQVIYNNISWPSYLHII